MRAAARAHPPPCEAKDMMELYAPHSAKMNSPPITACSYQT